jgi:kinesin family protein 6/9
MPKDKEEGYINNKEEKRSFHFNQIFDQDTRQEKVFDKVAKDVIDSALEGYNGTIFAYGQTGSGKTFTMTGGVDSYEDRGLIPRTLSYIFNECKQRTESIKVNISYLQIYQSTGYDLLSEENLTRKLEDLPKVEPR